jgi:hypothetical protein
VVVVVDAALAEAQERVPVLERAQRVRRRQARLPQVVAVDVAAVADVVVREAALLLLNLLHDLPMEP